MKINFNIIKKIFIITLWVILISGLFVILSFVKKAQDEMPCKSISIFVDTTCNLHFINDQIVKEIIKDSNDNFIGKPVSQIDIYNFEKLLKSNPYIENAEVYKTISGEINISIKQRKPLIRVASIANENYYIDSNGAVMPISNVFTTRVVVANGNIWEPYISFRRINISENDSINKTSNLSQLLILAKFIDKNEFWKSQITQLYLNKDGEFEIIPRLGNHLILFGDITDMEEKFENLFAVYQKGFKNVGWDKYSIINLKYKNQVVCTKKQL